MLQKMHTPEEVAREKLEPIINGFQRDAGILAWAASCMWGADRQVRALEVLGEAVELCPDAPELLWQRASYWRKFGTGADAIINELMHLLDVLDPQRHPTLIKASFNSIPWYDDDDGSTVYDDDGSPVYIKDYDKAYDELDGAPVYIPVYIKASVTARCSRHLPEEFRDERGRGRDSDLWYDYSDPLHGLAGINPYVVSALGKLRELSHKKYEEAKQKPCITSLSERDQARLFAFTPPPPSKPSPNPRDLILVKRWHEVRALLEPWVDDPEDCWSLEDIFHLFMAHWALGEEKLLHSRGEKAKVRFQRLQHTRGRPCLGISERQMMSLVYWKTGERGIAEKILSEIESGNLRQGKRIFSYWRYKDIPWDEFKEDCRLIRQMFKGAKLLPPIF